MKLLMMIMQICILCLISLFGNFVAEYLAIGIPGNIIGMFLLLLLLQQKIVSMDKIEMGANFLIAELLLFFIPSAIGVIQFQEALQQEWLQILFVIVASTLAVLLFVAAITESALKRKVARE